MVKNQIANIRNNRFVQLAQWKVDFLFVMIFQQSEFLANSEQNNHQY